MYEYRVSSMSLEIAAKLAENQSPAVVVVDEPRFIDGDIKTGPGVSWDIRAPVTVADTGRLWIAGHLIVRCLPAFSVRTPTDRNDAGVVFWAADRAIPQCSPLVPSINPRWFDTDDWGAANQIAIGAGAAKAVIQWPSMMGVWNPANPVFGEQTWGIIRTPIVLDHKKWGSHQKIVGQSHIGSTAVIEKDAGITAIDCASGGGADEVMIEGIHIAEQAGSHDSTCLATGGTTLKIKDCWFVVAKTGMQIEKGSEPEILGCGVEGCKTGIYVGNTSPPNFVRDLNVSQTWLGRNDIGIHYVTRPGGHVLMAHTWNQILIKKSKIRGLLMDCHRAGFASMSLQNSTIRDTARHQPSISPHCGALIQNGILQWVGGYCFSNPRHEPPGGEDGYGVIATGDSFVQLSHLCWGNKWPDQTGQDALFLAEPPANVESHGCYEMWGEALEDDEEDPLSRPWSEDL